MKKTLLMASLVASVFLAACGQEEETVVAPAATEPVAPAADMTPVTPVEPVTPVDPVAPADTTTAPATEAAPVVVVPVPVDGETPAGDAATTTPPTGTR